MNKEKGLQTLIIAVLAIAILIMSVGFAAYSQTLNINGTATVKSANWKVHFVDTTYAESTGSVQATSKTITDTDVTYTVTLTKPGDFYEFSINVENAGTINAKLQSITMSALTAAQAKYLTYKLTYDGTDYTATTTGLSNALNASASKTVKVRLDYVQPEQSEDLPATDATVTLTASLDYVQA